MRGDWPRGTGPPGKRSAPGRSPAAESRPGASAYACQRYEAASTIAGGADGSLDCAGWLALSHERDVALRLRLTAFREGWDACLDYLADAIGGRMMPSHPTSVQVTRWGPGGRERFADPRPGDYQGQGAGQ